MTQPRIEVDNQYSQLSFEVLDLINSSNEAISLLGIFKKVIVNESVSTGITSGMVIFNSEYSFRDEFPLNGNEKIRIRWRSSKDSDVRDYTFAVSQVPRISKVSGFTNEYTMYFIDQLFYDLLKPLPQCYVDKTVPQIFSSIFSSLKSSALVTSIESVDTETVTIYTFEEMQFDFLQSLRFVSSTPHVWYQREGKIILDTLYNFVKKYNSYEFNKEGTPHVNYTITEVEHLDVYDKTNAIQDATDEYSYLNLDMYAGSFSKQAKSSNRTWGKKKTEIDTSSTFRRNISSEGDLKYLFSDYIKAKIQYGNSGIYIGDRLNFPEIKNSKFERNSYSGDWCLHSITHEITSGFRYTQDIIGVRAELYK